MPYKKINGKIIGVIDDLIKINNEVLVELYNKKSIQDYYLINTLAMLTKMIKNTVAGDYITIYKNRQLPLRGTLNHEYELSAVNLYKKFDNNYYAIFNYVHYPEKLESFGAGSSLEELKEDFEELINDYKEEKLTLCFGEDPRPIYSKIHINEDDKFIVIDGEAQFVEE